MSKNNVLLITAPPRDQMTLDLFSCTWGQSLEACHQILFRYVKAFPRYELTSKLAPSPPNLIGCSGQMKSKAEKRH